MESVLRYSTPYSEPWVAWLMVLLLILLLMADHFQRGLIIDSFRSLTAAKERESLFSETTKTTAGIITLFIYKVLITSLTLYAVIVTGGFSFVRFLLVVLLVLALTAVKYITMWLTSYIFLNRDTFSLMVMHYGNLSSVVCILLYPVLLLVLFAPFVTHTVALAMVLAVAAFALVIWFIKAFGLFFTNFLAGFYIFLYLCTLELIPFAALVYAVGKLVL